MNHPPLRIGTRGSDLALWQARHVATRLAGAANIASEIVIVHTSGDRDRSRALHELPGSGFFTKELQRALLEGHVDLVVHSLKDLPIDEPEGLAVLAVPERADPRDMIVHRREAAGAGGLGLRAGARVGTSSLRRAAQALAIQPDLEVAALRGNVPTRLRKLVEGAFDAILLAKAGVDRLELDLAGLVARALPLDVFIPSPGQGALALEGRLRDDRAGAATVLHDPATGDATRCERAVLKGMGGGCHLPLGAHARVASHATSVDVAWGELDSGVTRATVRRARGTGQDADSAAAAALDALRAWDAA